MSVFTHLWFDPLLERAGRPLADAHQPLLVLQGREADGVVHVGLELLHEQTLVQHLTPQPLHLQARAAEQFKV